MIEAKDLKKIYGNDGVDTVALDGISLEIDRGEFVAIMGPSGSGKSTLLHILGMLDKHTSGTYQFNGKSMDQYSEEEIAKVRNKEIGFVFQAFNLLPRTTVLENVELPLIYSDVPEEEWQDKANAAVEAVGLSSRIHHESAQLSGGEKQRVAIARALVNDPEIIFADEPTGNLDSKSGRALMEIISKLNQMGKTIVLITHEEDIAAYAKRVIHMRDGKIEKDLIRK
ncbi:MAG: macrolide ABC transporter ATP-binding protein [Candidatus Colwellbacteria bacterium GWA2_46_10]|uniref:Macrolide ABC transporter ATP-binding protein n=1 Tax=Candidatus Colwellbacteria bacterium GWA2_46_10 TaxID=1797684 RepID=A0A1G1YZF0_9BACT|nr:MAG: macrolide ABC transporter ATP-binding protein [Candidatus Colwellbacteria bacterium GWA2_46_10]